MAFFGGEKKDNIAPLYLFIKLISLKTISYLLLTEISSQWHHHRQHKELKVPVILNTLKTSVIVLRINSNSVRGALWEWYGRGKLNWMQLPQLKSINRKERTRWGIYSRTKSLPTQTHTNLPNSEYQSTVGGRNAYSC